MLKKIRLTDFKSFVDEEVELAPLTLLVGANASGKSNLLDAIRFLQGRVFGLPPGEILDGEKRSGPEAWPGIRGRTEEAARVGRTSFALASTWLISEDWPEPIELLHRITCRTLPSPRLEREDVTTPSHSSEALDEQSLNIFWQETLLQVSFLDMTPSSMRGYGRRGGYPLGDDGGNISGVLADLCDDPVERQSVIDWLTELCAPELEGIDFIEVKELGDVMAILVEKGGRRISIRSASDGTLHFLGTLLALRTAEPGSVILIEEIETGLHPTRIRLLVEYLEAVTRERGIQIIATTHSPVVLQWLSDESLRNTIVFGRVPDHEGTLMRRLGDLPHFDEVVRRKGIEELFTTGWLEMAL